MYQFYQSSNPRSYFSSPQNIPAIIFYFSVHLLSSTFPSHSRDINGHDQHLYPPRAYGKTCFKISRFIYRFVLTSFPKVRSLMRTATLWYMPCRDLAKRSPTSILNLLIGSAPRKSEPSLVKRYPMAYSLLPFLQRILYIRHIQGSKLSSLVVYEDVWRFQSWGALQEFYCILSLGLYNVFSSVIIFSSFTFYCCNIVSCICNGSCSIIIM